MLRNLQWSIRHSTANKSTISISSSLSSKSSLSVVISAQLNFTTRSISVTQQSSVINKNNKNININNNTNNVPMIICTKREMYLPPLPKPRTWNDDMITNYKSNVIFCVLALLGHRFGRSSADDDDALS